MTPEERRKRVEYAVKMAEQGILVEPAYDREEWRAQSAEEWRAQSAKDAPTMPRVVDAEAVD